MYIYLSNKFFNVHVIRCFGNSLETILYLIAFNYFYSIKSKFNENIAIFTFIITIAFMVRCTSPIGFVIPILYKIYKEKSLFSFFIAGIGIATPLLFLIMLFDSFNY